MGFGSRLKAGILVTEEEAYGIRNAEVEMAKILTISKLGVAKEICSCRFPRAEGLSMTVDNFERRLTEWAKRQGDIRAIVVAGSRAREATGADQWSDWDLHLVADSPARYRGVSWLSDIAPVWCAHSEVTPRGFTKVSATFVGGIEVDFLPLAAWQMRLVYAAMKHRSLSWIYPVRLCRGIVEARAFLLGSGYRILFGNSEWEARMGAALQVDWPVTRLTEQEFGAVVGAFWQKAVWVAKKVARPEPRSALHWLHKLVTDQVYVVLAEEARIAGRVARAEARKAEQWLDEKRLQQTAMSTNMHQRVLAQSLLATIALFEDASASVARSRGFVMHDYTAVAAWLRGILEPLAEKN